MIGDIAKQSQAAITAVKNLWCLPRATRNKLTAERMREGHTRTHLVRPAVTRFEQLEGQVRALRTQVADLEGSAKKATEAAEERHKAWETIRDQM
jgi:phage shock protein A